MPACIFLVSDEVESVADAEAPLRAAGYDIVAFTDPLAALEALDGARPIELLITRAQFSPGSQNGVSLALMARQKRPLIKILFADAPEYRESTEGVGEFLAVPTADTDLVATVTRLLQQNE